MPGRKSKGRRNAKKLLVQQSPAAMGRMSANTSGFLPVDDATVGVRPITTESLQEEFGNMAVSQIHGASAQQVADTLGLGEEAKQLLHDSSWKMTTFEKVPASRPEQAAAIAHRCRHPELDAKTLPLKLRGPNGKMYRVPDWMPYYEKIRDFYFDCREIVEENGEVATRESFLNLATRDLKVTESWITSRIEGLKEMYTERKRLMDAMKSFENVYSEVPLSEMEETISEFQDELRHFRKQKDLLRHWTAALDGRFGDLDGLHFQAKVEEAKHRVDEEEAKGKALPLPCPTAATTTSIGRALSGSTDSSSDDIPLAMRNELPHITATEKKKLFVTLFCEWDKEENEKQRTVFGKWEPQDSNRLREITISGRDFERQMEQNGDCGVSLFEMAIYVTDMDIKSVKAMQCKHKIVLTEMELEMRRKMRQPGDREVMCTDDLLASAIASAEAGIQCAGNQAAKNVQHIKSVLAKMTVDEIKATTEESRIIVCRCQEHQTNLYRRLDDLRGRLDEAKRKLCTLKSLQTTWAKREAKRLARQREVEDQRRRAKELYAQREKEAQEARERAKGVERLNLWCRRHRIEQQKKKEQEEAAAAQRIREERLRVERAQRDAMRVQSQLSSPSACSQKQPCASNAHHRDLTREEKAHRDGFSNRCKEARTRDFDRRQDVERDAAAERRRFETVQKERDCIARRAKAEAVRTQACPQKATIASVIDNALSQKTQKNDIPMAKTVSVELGAGLGLGLYPELDALALGVPIMQGERV